MPMDFSHVHGCIPHDSLIGKLEAYSVIKLVCRC